MVASRNGSARTLEQMLADLKQKLDERQRLADETPIAHRTENLANNTAQGSRPQPHRGRARNAIVQAAQHSLFDGERRGRFTKLPIHPGTEFPSMLARLPIFVPGRRSTQRHLIDEDNAMPFESPWGKGRKHGPPLTVHDEDTLLVLGMLRQDRLSGKGSALPISVSDVLSQGDDIHVHALFTTISEIETRFGNAKNGQMFKNRLASIKRLASTRIEFETLSDKAVAKGTIVSLLDVAWERWEHEAVLYIQFSPVMAHWYEKAYSYLDWNVRMALPDTGKAIHRFLSSQPKEYKIHAEKLRRTIGYPRDAKYFARDMRESLRRLQDLAWLTTYHIEGNGRTKPHKLVVSRS